MSDKQFQLPIIPPLFKHYLNTEPRPVMPQVMQDLEDRYQLGLERYGKPVKPMDGEDYLKHLYEELMDACVYIKAVIEERKLRESK